MPFPIPESELTALEAEANAAGLTTIAYHDVYVNELGQICQGAWINAYRPGSDQAEFNACLPDVFRWKLNNWRQWN